MTFNKDLKLVYSYSERKGYINFGEYFINEWIEPLGLTILEVARRINEKEEELIEIINNKKILSKEIAWKLSAFFKMDQAFFLKKRDEYEAKKNKNEYFETIKGIVPINYSDLY